MALNPPRPPSLPLNALRAFESASRLGGFKAAAEELCVTPGAVAQQIKVLEAAVGAPLFWRSAQGVSLTALGAATAAEFSAAFDLLGVATSRLRSGAAPNVVRITALPSLAQLWLGPRLADLRARLPGVTISVTAAERPPHLLREPFDIALFFEPAAGASAAYNLGEDEIFPVCAPALAKRVHVPADLAGLVLLSDASWASDWDHWAATVPEVPQARPAGPVFSLYALAVSEAVAGAGFLMGHRHLVSDPLKSGALVAPFDDSAMLDRHLMLSVAPTAEQATGAARVAEMLSLTGGYGC
ncbi:MAG: LysR substrate-binding domain-containing protein [Pseudomonadota bacterium]